MKYNIFLLKYPFGILRIQDIWGYIFLLVKKGGVYKSCE
jgi:hypothetical protein